MFENVLKDLLKEDSEKQKMQRKIETLKRKRDVLKGMLKDLEEVHEYDAEVYEGTLADREKKVAKLTKENARLQKTCDAWKCKFENRPAELAHWERQYEKMKGKCEGFRRAYNSLSHDYDALEADHARISAEYSDLRSLHNTDVETP